MIKKILFIFVIFVFCLCIMGSKKEKAEILNASLFQTSYYEDVNINKVISSKQELIDFLNIYDGFSKEELTIINDTYNDDYFLSNELVIKYVTEKSSSISYKVSGINITNEDILINIEKESLDFITCDMVGWFIFIEKDKDINYNNVVLKFN